MRCQGEAAVLTVQLIKGLRTVGAVVTSLTGGLLKTLSLLLARKSYLLYLPV